MSIQRRHLAQAALAVLTAADISVTWVMSAHYGAAHSAAGQAAFLLCTMAGVYLAYRGAAGIGRLRYGEGIIAKVKLSRLDGILLGLAELTLAGYVTAWALSRHLPYPRLMGATFAAVMFARIAWLAFRRAWEDHQILRNPVLYLLAARGLADSEGRSGKDVA